MPKPVSGKLYIKEFRITPYNQQPICIDESDLQGVEKLIVCEEGVPNGQPQLHYHGYIETLKSETYMRQLFKKWSNVPEGISVNGNRLYFTRNPHEYTMGYITKSRNIVFNHGYDQSHIDMYFKQSDDYLKSKATDKKQKDCKREKELQDVIAEVRKDIDFRVMDVSSLPYRDVIKSILTVCEQKQVRFPTRSQMEYFVIDILYRHGFKQSAYDYYLKSFPNNI